MTELGSVVVLSFMKPEGEGSSPVLEDGLTRRGKAGKSFTVPLAYKIPVALADALQGKYLIFVAKADDFTADPYTAGVVIFGPIKLP